MGILTADGVKVRLWQADHEPRYLIEAEIPLDATIVPMSSRSGGHNSMVTLRWTDRDC